jgi:hypothetical protein
MSIEFTQLWLASLAGVATYALIETVYYEVVARINGKRYEQYLEEVEDETWEYFQK